MRKKQKTAPEEEPKKSFDKYMVFFKCGSSIIYNNKDSAVISAVFTQSVYGVEQRRKAEDRGVIYHLSFPNEDISLTPVVKSVNPCICE